MNKYLIAKLKEGRLNKGFKQSDVTSFTGIKNTTLSNYENGVTEPDIDTFLQLCELYELNYADILGEAYGLNVQGTDFDIKPSEIKHIKKYRSLDQFGQETVTYILDRESERTKHIADLESKPAAIIEFRSDSETPSRILQYFHSVSAGTGQVIFDDVYSERVAIPDIPEYGRVSYAVKVSGHSMEPLYYDEDMLLIEPTCEVELGEVGIFIVGNEAFVKKLGDGELISLNKGYDNIPLTADSKCMGRVVDRYIVE